MTDSYSSLKLGDTELFKSSLESLKTHKYSEYLDYYYIRFLEDFFDILPDITVSLPKNISQYINTFLKHEKLSSTLTSWFYSSPDTDESEDFYFSLSPFLIDWGRLSTSHLAVKSYVCFLHIDNDIIIRYDFIDQYEDGTPVWSAGKGEYTISYPDFICEIENLLNHFFTDMDKQVNDATLALKEDEEQKIYVSSYNRGNPAPSSSEIDCLLKEHRERKDFFYTKFKELKAGTLSNKPEFDWLDLEQNILKLLKL